MKQIVKLSILICSFLLSIGENPTSAQRPTIEYAHKHYTIHDGLAQMQVMSLFQDSSGYLLCQTKAGLSRFDGRTFKNFSTDIPSTLNFGVSPLSETENHGLLFFGKHGISELKKDSMNYHKFPDGCFYEGTGKRSDKYNLAVLHQPDRVYKLVVDYNDFDSIKTYELGNSFGPVVFFDEQDSLIVWQTNENKIYRVNYLTGEVVDSFESEEEIYSVEKCGERILGFSRDGKLWQYKNGSFQLVVDTHCSSYHFKAILAPDGETFIIKTDKELFKFKDKLVLVKDELTYIRDILFDDEGNLWVATEEGLYNFFNLNFVNYKFNKGNKDWVWSVLEDKGQNMWFASYQNGIWKWDGYEVADYSVQVNQSNRSDMLGLVNPYTQKKIVSINEVDNRVLPELRYRFYMGATVWGDKLVFPTEQNVLNWDGKNFSSVKDVVAGPYQVTKSFDDGSLWMGGFYGLFQRDSLGKVISWGKSELLNASVLDVEKDKNGSLIVAGKNGLSIINGNEITYRENDFIKNAYSLARDHYGNIWMGCGNHVTVWTGDSLFPVFKKDDEAFYSVCFIEPHYLLAGGIKGLYLTDLNNYYQNGLFEMIRYDQNNGFTGIECGQNGFFKDSKGKVWIPTSDLVIQFDPQKLVESPVHSPRLSCYGSISSDDITWEDFDITGSTKLPFYKNSIRFNFETISFTNLGKIRYYHRLKGLHPSWIGPSELDEVVFYNLKPGEYELQVYADPGINRARSRVINVSFQINEPFWLKWWFIVPVAFLLVWGVFILIKFLKKREQKKYSIERRMIQLKSEALAAQLDPHFVMNCLNNISGLVNTGYIEEANDYIVRFSKLLRVILQSIRKEHISLTAELEIVSNYLELEKLRSNNAFSYVINLPKNYSSESIQVPPMLLQPIVENSVKHGFKELKRRKGLIEISFAAENDQLQISIRDNGTGLKNHTSGGLGIGTRVTKERIQLLQKKHEIEFHVNELNPGIIVSFHIPLIMN